MSIYAAISIGSIERCTRSKTTWPCAYFVLNCCVRTPHADLWSAGMQDFAAEAGSGRTALPPGDGASSRVGYGHRLCRSTCRRPPASPGRDRRPRGAHARPDRRRAVHDLPHPVRRPLRLRPQRLLLRRQRPPGAELGAHVWRKKGDADHRGRAHRDQPAGNTYIRAAVRDPRPRGRHAAGLRPLRAAPARSARERAAAHASRRRRSGAACSTT